MTKYIAIRQAWYWIFSIYSENLPCLIVMEDIYLAVVKMRSNERFVYCKSSTTVLGYQFDFSAM